MDRPSDLRFDHGHRPAQPQPAAPPAPCCQQEVPVRHLRHPGHPPLGAAARHPGLRARARRLHHRRRDQRWSRSSTRTWSSSTSATSTGSATATSPAPRSRRLAGPRWRRPTYRWGASSTMLKSSGRWAASMVIVLADHSMDWSRPDQIDQPAAAARRRPAARGQGPDRRQRRRRPPLLDRARRPARRGRRPDATHRDGPPGRAVGPRPAASRRGCGSAPAAGDVVVYCRAGWRFSDPSQTDNPIPGNHGHPAT